MLRIFTILITLILLSPTQFAQEKNVLRPDGKIIKHKGDLKNLEAKSINLKKNGKSENLNQQINSSINSALEGEFVDTLEYWSLMTSPYVNFGAFDQDWLLQWFVAPADLNIRQVGFATLENPGNIEVQVKIVKVNWTLEELRAVGVTHWGSYEATGNGFNDITAFTDNPDKTGDWVNTGTGTTEPFGEDLWGDGGLGAPVDAEAQASGGVYQWVDMNLLGFMPAITKDEIFGIAIKNNGTTLNANRFGVWSDDGLTFPAWKFYADGSTGPNGVNGGWWSRPTYTWDFAVEIELTGDRAPQINSFTSILSGVDVGPFTVEANITDDNPGEPANAGVASATLNWSNDEGTTWNEVAMTGTEPDFTGDIPAQSPNTYVSYYIEATDNNANSAETSAREFFVFGPSDATTLVIFNGFSAVDGYPQDYYWGPNVNGNFDRDEWAYGAVPAEIMDNYTNVIEICLGGPNPYNDDVIRAWLEADGTRNYFLAGQEFLGGRHNYTDMDFAAGTFEYDILGVTHSYNDVSYDGTSGQELPSLVTPQVGTMFGGPILTLFNSLDPAADSLMYNPGYEIGDDNWIDGFEVIEGQEVDMTVETRGVGGAPSVNTYPTMTNRTLTAGNKILFQAYDPISLNTALDGDYAYYNWVGYDEANSAYQAAFVWFGIVLNVEEVGGTIPKEFSISQNYPNPFNPTTKINFSVPQSSFVSLKVYDVLGKEVATLVNHDMKSGNYVVDFDASNFASGLYIYKIQAGSFTTSKKMMLLK